MNLIWLVLDWFRELAVLLAIVATGLVLLAGLVVGYFPLTKYLPVVGPYVKVAKLAAFLAFGLLSGLLTFRFMDDHCTARIEADRAVAEVARKERDKDISQTLDRKYSPELARLKALNNELQKRVRDHAKRKPTTGGGGNCRLGDAADGVRARARAPSGTSPSRSADHLRADPRAR